MRPRLLVGSALLLLPAGLSAIFASGAQGPPGSVVPAKHEEPAPRAKSPDLAKLGPQQRQTYLAARRATDWLRRTNKQDGRFVYGFLPDLRVVVSGDSYVAQAGAAF